MDKLFSNITITKELAVFNSAVAVAGGFLYTKLGGYNKWLEILLFMMLADYLTGFINAWHNKNLSSKVGLWGIAKKIGLLSMVALAAMIGSALGKPITRELVIFWLMSNEGLSLFENYANMGLPLHPGIKKRLKQLKSKSEKLIDVLIDPEGK